MPTYTWTARDKDGAEVVREILAPSSEAAKTVLVSEGCTELKLVGDEVAEAAQQSFTEKMVFLGEELEVTPADRLKQHGAEPSTFWSMLKQGLATSKALTLVLVLLGAYKLYRGNIPAALLVLFGWVVWISFTVLIGLPSIYFGRLLKATDWCRWGEVLSLVDTLTKLRRVHFVKVPETELIRFRSLALAGLGRLPEALETYRQCKDQPGYPDWLYTAHLAGIFDRANLHDRAVELTLEAIRMKPCQALQLDLASRLLLYRRDAVKARAALAEAEKSTIVEVAKPFHLGCRGILAYLEGDLLAAKRGLQASIGLMLENPHAPFRDGHLSVARAYLACVLAGLGERTAAQQSLAQAEGYLLATKGGVLLAECRQALQSA